MLNQEIAIKTLITNKIPDHYGEIKPEDCNYLADLDFIADMAETIFNFAVKNRQTEEKFYQDNHECQFTIDKREKNLSMSAMDLHDTSIYQDPKKYRDEPNRYSLEVIYRTKENSYFHFRVSHAWVKVLHEIYKKPLLSGRVFLNQTSGYDARQNLLPSQSQSKSLPLPESD